MQKEISVALGIIGMILFVAVFLSLITLKLVFNQFSILSAIILLAAMSLIEISMRTKK